MEKLHYSLRELTGPFFDMFELKDDADKTCFRKSVELFLSTGKKEDAFLVYFCFSEIFNVFGKGYDNTQKLLETLSDHEYHSGALLSKHRDHYSHSVYVFALGLAIYANDSTYRKSFLNFYDIVDEKEGALIFLKYWGMSSLFHDIGYPFQLAHEQIYTYTKEMWGDSKTQNVYVSYSGNIDNFLKINDNLSAKIKESLGADTDFNSINQVLSYGLWLREGYPRKYIEEKLMDRVVRQPKFCDHGYFSAVILIKQLLLVPKFTLDIMTLDTLTAILLHNSLNKHDIGKVSHPISLKEHPLSYLLILCDELQCWDRHAYGKESVRDPIAWKARFQIKDNYILGKYFFEKDTVIDTDGRTRLNKLLDDIESQKMQKKILEGYDGKPAYIMSTLKLELDTGEQEKKKILKAYASDDNFINLCDFAKAIHAGYLNITQGDIAEQVNQNFGNLPLPYKVSNILQAKSYAEKLELVNCFYSSKMLDYPEVTDLAASNYGKEGSDNFGFLCREEHVRWVKEKIALGWKYGQYGVDYDNSNREEKKRHKCLVPYEFLSEEDKEKDRVMIHNIIPNLQKFGHNVKIYSYRSGRKPDLEITCIGRRYIKYPDREELKRQVKEYLGEQKKKYRVIIRSSFFYGAEQLIAECANEMGISTKAILPYKFDKFLNYVKEDAIKNGVDYTQDDEDRLRLLLAQTVVCKEFEDEKDPMATLKYNLQKSQQVLALWEEDRTEDIIMGEGKFVEKNGTFACVKLAEKILGKRAVDSIHCYRM